MFSCHQHLSNQFNIVFITLCLSSEHKLVMVGLDNAGKTTILYQFLMNEVVHTSPTIGSNVEEIVWKNIHFLVWDLAGKPFNGNMNFKCTDHQHISYILFGSISNELLLSLQKLRIHTIGGIRN